MSLETSPTARPRVIYATIYPPNPEGRAETFVTRELLREYAAEERGFDLSVVIASAHPASLAAAEKVLAEFPAVPARLIHLETEHAGIRPEEISFCKEKLPERLMAEEFDYLLFMDADVWTPISQVAGWIAIIGGETRRRFVKVKYCLRDKLASPHDTLGAYFHHKALLEETRYWEKIFPRDAHGRRRGAPDCVLHNYLEGGGCRKIVPERLMTYHFTNADDAQVYQHGQLYSLVGARAGVASGEARREALEP